MKNILVTLFLVTSVVFSLKAQTPELKKIIKSADVRFDMHDYYGAEKLYAEAYSMDSTNATVNFRLGVCKFEMKDHKSAEFYFIKSSSAVSLEIFRYKAAIAHADKKFKKAINYYNAYKIINGEKDLTNEEANNLIAKAIYAENVIKNPRNVSIINVGSNINTEYDEYVPLISADEEIMIFTSRRPESTGKLLDPNGRYFEDIYSSKSLGKEWQKPVQLGKGINTNTNDASAGLSADGQLLFIFRTNEDLISGDLYECRMGLDEWEMPKKMPSNINSKDIESSASIVPNERTLYFSSDREGGFGGKDIYKVERLPNGTWGAVQNLGPTVNTAEDEDAPFIHADGKTLYFSSTGHQNMGGYDIFKTKLNEAGEWSNPENLGYPINSVTDDIFYVVAADGKTGYYSSSREGGYGGQDIYKVLLKDEYEKLTVIKGEVLGKDNVPVSAKITLIELESASIQGIYKSKEGTGKFIMLVEPGKTYNYVIQADGYHPKTDELDFDIKSSTPIKFNLEAKN
ncbi:MAG: PD40 domain-containing protein [Flavobacteriales bacterium]|nr:PD40 domain-containing protein [Flavobacteriales bacterium]MCB9364213.1 PD40 domain-containing protein [Flavobacteriales bacterium]